MAGTALGVALISTLLRDVSVDGSSGQEVRKGKLLDRKQGERLVDFVLNREGEREKEKNQKNDVRPRAR